MYISSCGVYIFVSVSTTRTAAVNLSGHLRCGYGILIWKILDIRWRYHDAVIIAQSAYTLHLSIPVHMATVCGFVHISMEMDLELLLP